VTLNDVADSLTAGAVYKLRYRAVNSVSEGPYSDELTTSLIAPPAAPSAPVRVDNLSNKTTIFVKWDPVSDGAGSPAGDIIGYRLYMAVGPSASYSLIYDGLDFRTIHSRKVTDLVTGKLYRFKVSAINFNGEGDLSPEMQTRACTAPSQMEAPLRTQSTATTINLEWKEPEDDGGCPITSYAVFRDDGAAGEVTTEVNADSDTNIRDKPSLFQMQVTNFPTDPTGLTFSYRVQAFNEIQSSFSNTVSYILAATPSAPSSGPADDVLVTSSSQIKVDFDPLTTLVETGGSFVLSYNLQMDDGTGVFFDVFGEIYDSLQTTYLAYGHFVEKGETYQFRYRANNIYGWGPWSPTTSILAADVPEAPPQPTFVSASDNSITLDLYASEDEGGSFVTDYELWMDEGDFNTDFSLVDSYDTASFALQHTLTFADDGVVTGKIYSFKFRALNVKGYSEYSEFVSIAAIDPPHKANSVTVDYSLSTRTSLFVSWDVNTDAAGPGGLVTGYSLLVDDGTYGIFNETLNTVGTSPLVSSHYLTGLNTSRIYRFKVIAFNFNPTPGEESDISSFDVCEPPSHFAKPTKFATSLSSISVNWNEPQDNGGCSI